MSKGTENSLIHKFLYYAIVPNLRSMCRRPMLRYKSYRILNFHGSQKFISFGTNFNSSLYRCVCVAGRVLMVRWKYMNMIAKDGNWINLTVVKNLIKFSFSSPLALLLFRRAPRSNNLWKEGQQKRDRKLQEFAQIKASLFQINFIAFS